ncbi:hypothetical protein U9J33_02960 [Novosphingobium sp. RL4]|nr:hypothetical protein [Novosphingobium sp. RL4]WRT93484.1 hypothetical protein U9J33_02960 [Novosphingobium sp. RL4]
MANVAGMAWVRYVARMNDRQREICNRFGADFVPSDDNLIVGISKGALKDEVPLHGLRHPPDQGTTGWFIWQVNILLLQTSSGLRTSHICRDHAQQQSLTLHCRRGGGF